MAEEIELELGSFHGRTYLLKIRGDPNCEQPDDFAVLIYYKSSSDESGTVVARVDNSHGYTHFEKLYRSDESEERVGWGIWEAVEKLSGEWRRYARIHESE